MRSAPNPVATIVNREFPGNEIRDVVSVSGGRKDTYIVTLSDRRVVVSICGRGCDTAGFEVEPGVVDLVRRRSDLPVPKVLAKSLSTAPPAMYFVSEYVEGDSLGDRFPSFPAEVQKTVLEHAGQYLGQLHREVTCDDFGRLRRADRYGSVAVDPADSWVDCLRDLMDDWIARLPGGRFTDLAPTFAAVRDDCSEYLDRDAFDPVLLHFDYRPANLLCDGSDLVAVLDWGLALAGHAEYDLVKAEKNFLLAQFESASVRDALRPSLYQGYTTAHELASDWRTRRDFYRVAHKLESMYSFERWTHGLRADQRDELEQTLRAELKERLGEL